MIAQAVIAAPFLGGLAVFLLVIVDLFRTS